MAIAAAIAEWAFFRQTELAAEAKTAEVTRIAASAIDVELQQSLSALQGVTLSPLLDAPPDLKRFRTMLERFIENAHGWSTLTLAQPDGTVLVSTAVDDGPLPAIFERDSFDRAVKSARPVVGGVGRRPDGSWGIALRIPVMRGDRLLYVLSATQSPETFRAIVDQLRLPDTWTLSVFDSRGARVARSREHAANLGGAAAPSLKALMASGEVSGSGITETLEGVRGYTAYTRLPKHGWAVAIGIPAATVISAAIQPVTFYALGLAIALILALVLARIAAQRIAEPIDALAKAAPMIAEGRMPPIERSSFREIATLGDSLLDAARARRRIEQERAIVADERDALLESERAARNEAVRMGQLKDQFLATLSHELRTPLNSILGWAEILKHGRATEADRHQGLDIIERNARSQAKLIEELLDVSRITSGKIHLDLQLLEPAVAIHGAIDASRPAAEAKGVRLEVRLDVSVGRISADPARLQQIIGNLVSNAIKFTPRDGAVRVELGRAGDWVEIIVSDTGEGIDPQFLPHIFDRFRQGDASTTRKYGGLGLGLSIVRDLIALHGGTVQARSDGKGSGSAFVVRLPRATSEPLHAGSSSPGLQLLDLSGVRVLVVDDDADARALVERLLEESHATVSSAGSAEEGMQALRQSMPDVLVSDISMPEVDGYEFLRRVRSLEVPGAQAVAAIALTAFARDTDRERVLAAGFAAHITKPVDLSKLIAEVGRLARR